MHAFARLAPIVLTLLAVISLVGSARTAERGAQATIDYLYPGQAPRWLGAIGPTPAWVDVPIPTDRVDVLRLRILTGGHAWTFSVCESRVLDSSCTTPLPQTATNGWDGDFAVIDAFAYEDKIATQRLHLHVESLNGDWMTFRVILTVDPDAP